MSVFYCSKSVIFFIKYGLSIYLLLSKVAHICSLCAAVSVAGLAPSPERDVYRKACVSLVASILHTLFRVILIIYPLPEMRHPGVLYSSSVATAAFASVWVRKFCYILLFSLAARKQE